MSQMQPLRHRAWRNGRVGVAVRKAPTSEMGEHEAIRNFASRCCSTLRLRNTEDSVASDQYRADTCSVVVVRVLREGRPGVFIGERLGRSAGSAKARARRPQGGPWKAFCSEPSTICDLCNQLPAPTSRLVQGLISREIRPAVFGGRTRRTR